MNIGTNQTLRPKLRMTIHRGGTGQRPNRLGSTHAVASNVVILSGQIMTLQPNAAKSQNEWILGFDSHKSLRNTFYIAVDDSTDGDNVEAGTLQGLSVRGAFEISTSAFKAGETYRTGDPLTVDGTTGNFKKAVTATDHVIAHVVKDYAAPVNLGATYTGLQPSPATTVSSGVQGGVFKRARETNAQDLSRLRVELVAPYFYQAS